MTARILLLQEKSENIANIEAALPEFELHVFDHVSHALAAMHETRYHVVISAVHLEHDGSVFDFLKSVKSTPEFKHIPFIFYCSKLSSFARSVRHGLQIAAHALGADKYITMEQYNRDELRSEVLEVLLWSPEHDDVPPTRQSMIDDAAAGTDAPISS